MRPRWAGQKPATTDHGIKNMSLNPNPNLVSYFPNSGISKLTVKSSKVWALRIR